MEHEQVVRWRAMNRRVLEEAAWPNEVISELGDLEERIAGQRIFQQGKVRRAWPKQIDELKQQMRCVMDVDSVSKRNVIYMITLNLMLNKERKYEITYTDHSCPDTTFQRMIYKREPRVPGPDQHEIASAFGLQDDPVFKTHVVQKYNMWPEDFMRVCGKLDKYFENRGDFSSILRRRTKYILNELAYSSEPRKELLEKFKGSLPVINLKFKNKNEHSVAIIATPYTTPRSEKTVFEIRFGKNNEFLVARNLNYKMLLDARKR
ncbi:MAG: hypothetical protein V1839_02115 [archaeon]